MTEPLMLIAVVIIAISQAVIAALTIEFFLERRRDKVAQADTQAAQFRAYEDHLRRMEVQAQQYKDTQADFTKAAQANIEEWMKTVQETMREGEIHDSR